MSEYRAPRFSRQASTALLACCGAFVAVGALAVEPFPGTVPGLEIGVNLPATFEPSGEAWSPRLEQLFLCSDSGQIARMNRDGSATVTWALSGNWEGIAIADPASDLVYVVNENTAHIREFDFVLGGALRDFNLTTATPAPGVEALTSADLDALRDQGDHTGSEALTFVPDPLDIEGGLFWVGSQENGTIYKFRLALSTGTSVTFMGKFKSWTMNDLQGLEYDWSNGGVVLGIFGGSNRLIAVTLDGVLLHTWSAPAPTASGEEGVAYDGRYLFVAHDPAPAHEVWRYDDFHFDIPVELQVVKPGSGEGLVQSSPPGIDCGAVCIAEFPQGSAPALSQVPAPGSLFSGWSGACSGLGECAVLMDGPRLVTATFLTLGIFQDGFESGDTLAWSGSVGVEDGTDALLP